MHCIIFSMYLQEKIKLLYVINFLFRIESYLNIFQTSVFMLNLVLFKRGKIKRNVGKCIFCKAVEKLVTKPLQNPFLRSKTKLENTFPSS